MAGNEFMDVDAAAELLGLHPETVRRFAREQRIPAFKTGRSWRFSETRLVEWARQTGGNFVRLCHVLVVDDDETVRNIMRVTLERAGFGVTAAADALTALTKITAGLPDIAILDLNLVGETGVAVLRELRKLSPDLPVIIVTGFPDSDLMSEAMQFSPITVIAKPLRRDHLLSAVRQIAGMDRAGR